MPREAGTHVPGIFVVVTNFVGERKCAQRAAVAAGAARGVAVMLQSSVTITAVIDELILTREMGETRRHTDASPLTALPSDSARASAPWKPSEFIAGSGAKGEESPAVLCTACPAHEQQ